MTLPNLSAALGLLLALAGPSPADQPPMTDVKVFPAEINLTTAADRQTIVVQAAYADGVTRDVTGEATLAIADPSLVRRDGPTFRPLADGETTLNVSFGGRTATLPIKVARAKDEPPLSFRLDVMPVFMKAGCNTGSCHGAARGKDGFRLSLFGFDPDGDHFRLTREMSGRRVNLAVPAESTVVEKAVGAVQHTGGKRFEPSGEMYATLVRWIEAGAPTTTRPSSRRWSPSTSIRSRPSSTAPARPSG